MKIHWSKIHLNKKQTKATKPKPKPKPRRVVETIDDDDGADDDGENGDEVADADVSTMFLLLNQSYLNI